MYFQQYLFILIWLVIIPTIIGIMIVNQLFKDKTTDLLLAWVCGFISILSVFYVLVMPLLFLNMSLQTLTICWSDVVLWLSIISIVLNRNHFKEIIGHNLHQIKKMNLLSILVILLIFVQVFVIVKYMHEDADDAFYVANATTALATDSIFQFDPFTGELFQSYPMNYVLSPFSIFIAIVSKLLTLHPAIVAHTILPTIFIPLSYATFAVLGKKIFIDRPHTVTLFLIFLCMVNIYGNNSIYTSSSFLLFRIWQGKAVLANIILPGILYFSYRAMTSEKNVGEWVMLFCCILAACLSSSMGIALAPIMLCCLGLIFAIKRRQFRTILKSIACCIPSIACIIIYVCLLKTV